MDLGKRMGVWGIYDDSGFSGAQKCGGDSVKNLRHWIRVTFDFVRAGVASQQENMQDASV